MKIKEEKHNHKLTEFLKIFIFSIIMLLPFFAMLPSTLYFAFNHNAKEYTDQTINETYEYETNEVTSNDDLIEGNIYKIHLPPYTFFEEKTYRFTQLYYFSSMKNYYFNSSYYSDYGYISQSNGSITLYIGQGNTFDLGSVFTDTNYFYIVYYDNFYNTTYNTFDIVQSDYLGQVTYTINNNEMNPLNVVSNSIENLENATWFNWVENTTTYTTIKTMTDQLQIQLLIIPMLLTYWFLLIVIYLIIDIVMKVITTLTHMIGMKS